MADKPSYKPEFATADVVDPTSGQNNAIEPPASWKSDGWSYQEKPPRNYFNWLHRYAYLWIDYLDDRVQRASTISVAAADASQEAQDCADYVCDGADDDVQILAAIADITGLATAPGGTILLSEGNFEIDASIVMDDNIRIQGQGIGATVVKIKQDASSSFAAFDMSSKSRAVLSDLTIDSGTQSTYGHVGVKLDTSNYCRIIRCLVKNMIKNAVSNMGDGIAFVDTSSSQYCSIIDCEAIDCIEHGIKMGSNTVYSMVANCRAISCDTAGIHASGTSNIVTGNHVAGNAQGILVSGATKCRIDGNSIATSAAGAGIDVSGSTWCSIDGNEITENNAHGIDLDGDDCSCCNNLVAHNSQTTDDTSDGIIVYGDNNNIQCNTVRKGSTKRHRYGINVAAGATNNWVSGNDLYTGGQTGNFNDSGTGTLFPLASYEIWTGAAHIAVTAAMMNRV